MPSKSVPVTCGSCNWRGRRARGECACYDEWAMSCSCAWGRCPKCNDQVWPTVTLKEWKRSAEEGEAYYQAHKDEIHALANRLVAAPSERC